MNWLEPDPTFAPVVRSLISFEGHRVVFNVEGWWQYFPSFASEREYGEALDRLVQGAWLALSRADMVRVSPDPFGSRWIDVLLPLWRWDPQEGLASDWHPSIAQYARLFVDGPLDGHYTGGCCSHTPELTLRRCADLVIRNYAPASWLVSPLQGGVAVYFHNTTSFGVCVPKGSSYDLTVLVEELRGIGLESHPIIP
jgi:hypothetical protein